jgi:alpha,alpha-trehalase
MQRFTLLFLVLLSVLITSCRETPPVTQPLSEAELRMLPPDERYGDLFKEVQMAKVFPDGKTFADCIPKKATREIISAYEKQKGAEGFSMESFVDEYFDEPHQYASGFQTDAGRSPQEHINALWPILTRQPDVQNPGTLIPLPNSYIVPGGRFGEIYYWDSYFTMLGLQSAGKVDMIENMVANFAHLIDTIGFIPNGNRTYFLGRSQPPFFGAMVSLLAEERGQEVLQGYLPTLLKEYEFWMSGDRAVKLRGGSVLNRYWDQYSKPRPEMYHDDVELAKKAERPAKDLYQDIRAACESGWDFSSRWFSDPQSLATIRTTQLIPVDLNALLYHLERTIAEAARLEGNEEQAAEFEEKANQRKAAILRFCWDEERGYFYDYDLKKKEPSSIPTLAGMYPLFFNIADTAQAVQSAQMIENEFLKAGGLVTTLNTTGQQWDAPNGWAPLQWVAIQGLRNYGINELSDEIKERWVALNVKVYLNTGKMVEKYNVVDMDLDAGGGEYPLQDGFGWTNGVLLRLLSE